MAREKGAVRTKAGEKSGRLSRENLEQHAK